MIEGRTLFPSTVVDVKDSPRLFVSGHNNPKLGAAVRKGPRAGWPIFHLTLEERATCPRSCAVYDYCFGNGMYRARRHRHGPDLEAMIVEELDLLSRDYPDGYLIRLHTLGDFYSVGYVALWAQMLKKHPALHVFGYTARTEQDDDAESQRIAAALVRLTEARWSRFAIRFSRPGGGPQGAFVVDADPCRPDTVVCPAQTGGTAACATCGLCWVDAYRDRAIAFLRHGMVHASGPRRPGAVPNRFKTPVQPPKRPEEGPITPQLRRLAAAGDKIAEAALARKIAIFGDNGGDG